MRRLLGVLLVLALAAAGCGGDAKERNAYVGAVNRAQNDFAATFDRLSRRITSTSTPEQDRRTLDGFEAAVDQVVRDLRAIDVPPEVRDLHRRLIDAIAGYGDEIQRAQKAFRSRDPQEILGAQADLVRAVTAVSARVSRTIDAINRKLGE